MSTTMLWYEQPAEKWTQALPLGNGRLGAMVYGGVEQERICLNEDTLWSGYPRHAFREDAFVYMDFIRTFVERDERDRAEKLFEQYVAGRPAQVYLPAGDLVLDMEGADTGTPVEQYTRSLNLEDAVARATYLTRGVLYTRECFVSAADQVFVLRLTANVKDAISFRVKYECPLRHTVRVRDDMLILEGECPGDVIDMQDPEDPSGGPEHLRYCDEPQRRGIRYAVCAGVHIMGGSLSALPEEDGIRVSGANMAYIMVSVRTSFDGYMHHPYLQPKLYLEPATLEAEDAMKRGFSSLLQRHVAEYQTLFRRVSIDLGSSATEQLSTNLRLQELARGQKDPSLYALMFQYGRYLLISSSRPGTQAANLQGIWNHELLAPWHSAYTVNINTQMNYWPAESCALPECVSPLFDLIRESMVTGEATARAYHNARGFAMYHNTDLWRQTTPVGYGKEGCVRYAMWPMAGAWLARHLYEHFEYTMDQDFLYQQAYPVLRAASLFCLDILTKNENGAWWISPATSPENRLSQESYSGPIAQNAEINMAIARDLFQNTLRTGQILKSLGMEVDEALLTEIMERLPLLYPPLIGNDGRLLEWEKEYDEPEVHHRHISHLYGLYPAGQIAWQHTPVLAEACRKSLEVRGDEGTGWSMAWKMNAWARLQDGERALGELRQMMRPIPEAEGVGFAGGTYPNLFCAHPPFQIDGNFGSAAGVAEMLVQSREGEILLLPALPVEWRSGWVRGLCAKGGITVDIAWSNGQLVDASLTSTKTISLRVLYRDRFWNIFFDGQEKVNLR